MRTFIGQEGNGESIFRDFVRTSFLDGPLSRESFKPSQLLATVYIILCTVPFLKNKV